MVDQFYTLYLSYKSAPLHVRERVALDSQEINDLLRKFQEVLGLEEALLLSTCNRTEIYYSAPEPCHQEILALLAVERGLGTAAVLQDLFQVFHAEAAVKHLFRVSLGLEAQVLGDMQISNQVKRAYQLSADAQMAGPFLHRLMHTIFFSNKRVVQETPFRDGAASVSYAAVELAEELTSQITDPRVLVIGVGEIGADVVRNLVDSKLSRVTVMNRTFDKAQELATECGFVARPMEEFTEALKEADLVVSSVGGKEPLVTKEVVESLNILSFKFFLDLSVPRSVAKEVEDVPGALLYNVDAIHAKTNEALERRQLAIPQVEQIVEESLADFYDWSQDMIVSPTIKRLKAALEQIRQEEIAKHLKKLSQEETKAVEMVTKSMMQKIIKLPVLHLKAACRRGEAEDLIDVLNDLFNLEQTQASAADK